MASDNATEFFKYLREECKRISAFRVIYSSKDLNFDGTRLAGGIPSEEDAEKMPKPVLVAEPPTYGHVVSILKPYGNRPVVSVRKDQLEVNYPRLTALCAAEVGASVTAATEFLLAVMNAPAWSMDNKTGSTRCFLSSKLAFNTLTT